MPADRAARLLEEAPVARLFLLAVLLRRDQEAQTPVLQQGDHLGRTELPVQHQVIDRQAGPPGLREQFGDGILQEPFGVDGQQAQGEAALGA